LLSLSSLTVAVLIDERANRALQRSHDKLEHRVQERMAELKASEERFSLAVRGVGAGIWDWVPKTGTGWSSERFKKLLGYGNDDVDESFSNIVNITHADDRKAVAAALQNHHFTKNCGGQFLAGKVGKVTSLTKRKAGRNFGKALLFHPFKMTRAKSPISLR